jgi:hypothetical protein
VKLKGAELLVLLVLLSRRRSGSVPQGGDRTWVPPPGPDGLNVPVIPLPPNPLEQR